MTFSGNQNVFEGVATLSLDALFKSLAHKGIKYLKKAYVTGFFYDGGSTRVNIMDFTCVLRPVQPELRTSKAYVLTDTTPLAPGVSALSKENHFALFNTNFPWEGCVEIPKEIEVSYWAATAQILGALDNISAYITLELG